MKINELEIDKPICAIVTLQDGSVNPATLYQAVIDPTKVSPSGDYIRFTNDNHCEIHGWKQVSAIQILEVLEPVEEVK